MRILIAFYSGTGNTAYLAHKLASKLQAQGLLCDASAIEILEPRQVAAADLLVLGFPVYGLCAPGIVQDFVDALDVVQEKCSLVFTTQAYFAGGAPRRGLEHLATKGYTPMGAETINMPGSDGLMVMAKDSGQVKRALQRDYTHLPELTRLAARIVEIATALEQGGPVAPLSAPLPLGLLPGLVRRPLRSLLGLIFRGLGRKLWANADCTRCGQCVRSCPVGNISMDAGGVHWSNGCQFCVRCLHQCPAEAIQWGRMTQGKMRWRGPEGSYRPPTLRD